MLRRASTEDAASIYRVHMASIRGLARDHYSAVQIEAWCGKRSPESYLRPLAEDVMFVAESQGDVVAFSQMNIQKCSVEAVYVHPQHVRQHLGNQLLRAVEASAVAAGIAELTLQASLNAVPFYTAAGYIPGALAHHVVGGGAVIPCLTMSRILR